MGLQDRDSMRQRRGNTDEVMGEHRSPYFPPNKETSYLVIVFWWVAVAAALYAAFDWWAGKHRDFRVVRYPATRAQQPGRDAEVTVLRPAPKTPISEVPAPEVPRAEARGQLRRLVPIPRESGAEEARPTPPQPQQATAPGSTGTIYLCKAYAGGTFWAQAHCGQHQALIERIATVPPGLPFDQQVRIAQMQRQAAEQETYVAPTPSVATEAALSNKGECKTLDARIEQLDAMARQPQSASTQDWLRAERQAARDRQFRLRC